MAEIIKTFKESVPAMRFIGKKYPDFGGWWGDWFANGLFDEIEKAMGGADTILKIWENGAGYVGLERRCDDSHLNIGLVCSHLPILLFLMVLNMLISLQ